MSWFSKKLKKITKVVDPIGAKLRKGTGGSYGDPMNWYQSKPKAVVPYEQPGNPGLHPDPGTGGPGIKLGGGGNYTPNPFANQMAQAAVLRGPQQAPLAPSMAPMMAQSMAPQAPMPNGMKGNTMFQPSPQGQKVPMMGF